MRACKLVAIVGVALAAGFWSVPSRAGSSPTSSVACGTSSSGWNAPAGAVVFNRSVGPIRAILDAVGESRTHTMISHAPGGYTSHSTMYTPGQPAWPSYCTTPLNPSEALSGNPGFSQTTQGGIYTFYYGGGTSQEYIYYQNGNGDGANRGNAIQSWLWSSMPYQWVASQQNSGQGLYRLKWTTGANDFMPYVFYQFRDMQGITTGGRPYNSGSICSTAAALGQYKAGQGAVADDGSYTYDHTRVANALNALYNNVNNECSSSLGFWKGFGAGASCVDFNGICDEAADQVATCFATGNCNNPSNYKCGFLGIGCEPDWHGVRDNGGATAHSISPDAVGGWAGHPVGSTAPRPVWSYDYNHTVSWNSGGNVYSCWF